MDCPVPSLPHVRFWGFGCEKDKGHPPSHPSSTKKGGEKNLERFHGKIWEKPPRQLSQCWKYSSTRWRGASAFHLKMDVWSKSFSRDITRERTSPQLCPVPPASNPSCSPNPRIHSCQITVVGAEKHDDHWTTSQGPLTGSPMVIVLEYV